MRHLINYNLILLLVLAYGVDVFAQGSVTKQEEIVVVEGDDYIFKSTPGTEYSVSRRRIASSSGNGTITAKKKGRTRITITSPFGKEDVRLRVLPKKVVNIKGEFPILAWYSLQDDLSKERFMELADAGFNISFSYATDSIVPQMRRAIKSIKGTGVKLLIPFRGPWVNLTPIVANFRDDADLWGWYVADEPSYDQFDEVKRFVDRIRALDSTHPFYINLLPTYAPISSFADASYEQYVTKYVKMFSPPFLSFDHYPITSNGVRKDFYKNLDIISAVANQNGIPFWAFACSVKYSGGVPAPKLEHIKLEVYSALAFGAQGIEYFTYTIPRNEHGGNHFSDAPLDSNQKRTRTYDYIKEVNTRLRSLERFFNDAKVNYRGALEGTLEGIADYEKREFPKGIVSVSSSTPLLASWIQNAAGSIFVLVNTDIYKVSTVKVDADATIQKVSNDGQLVSVSPVEELLPGDMLVYLVEAFE